MTLRPPANARRVFLGVFVAATMGVMARNAWASSIAYTTIPDNSGAVTCSGTNPNSTTCTWTIGGSIAYSAWAGLHWSQGYAYIVPQTNPDTAHLPLPNQSCYMVVNGSSNISAPGVAVDAKAYLYYGQWGAGYLIDTLASGINTLSPSGTMEFGFMHPTLDDVIDTQYKVAARQDTIPASGWTTAATPGL